MIQKLTLTITMCLIGLTSSAQDTLKLINGKQKVVVVNYETAEYVIYQKIKKGNTSNLSKQKSKDKEDIFEVAYYYDGNPDSLPKVSHVYQVDSVMDDYFTIPEMRRFLEGRNQARKNYKAGWLYALGGLGWGTAGAYISPFSFWGVLPPAGYTAISTSVVMKPFKKADDASLFNDLHFNAGYKEQARHKNARYSALGSIIGLVVGTIVFDNVLAK